MREFLSAGLVDVMQVVLVPIVLGRGVSLWEGLEGLEDGYDVESIPSATTGVMHLIFRRKADPSGAVHNRKGTARVRAQ